MKKRKRSIQKEIKKYLPFALAGLLVVFLYAFFFWSYFEERRAERNPARDVPEAAALPPGDRILFENVPDCGVVKNPAEKQYTYDFFCKNKVIGQAVLPGNWRVEHFLSYEGGRELFGFFPYRSGEADKYYWGPSILYALDTETGTLRKFFDLSAAADASLSRPWGSQFFITDVSPDLSRVAYCNYFDKNAIFIRDMATGKTERFAIDPKLSDFGDATFSDDGKQIAFAGMKRSALRPGRASAFVEAALYVLDLEQGKIAFQEAKREPGMYSIYGWYSGKVDFEYLSENGR